jgi:hypothetical protein
MAESELISLPAAASRLSLSWSRAWRLALTGELKAHQIGRHWFVEETSVREFEERTAQDQRAAV